jgi:hypothetical protein
MMTRTYFLAAALLISACVPSEPTVTDYNGDSVKIAVTNFAGEGQKPSTATDAEALRICTKGGKRTAEYASSRWINDIQFEHLYLCL